MTLREELRTHLRTWAAALTGELTDDTSLIASGVLDSLGLFNLVLWIEEKTGRTVDPTRVDLASEWDSVGMIVRYIERSAPPPEQAPRARATWRSALAPVELVRYTPDHRRDVAQLQTRLWSPDPALNERYLQWKYERNPYGGEPEIFLAYEHGEIVGMRGFYASCWIVDGLPTPTRLLVADDFVLREDKRNTGLMSGIMGTACAALREGGHEFVLNLSGGPVTVLSSLAMGWRSAGNLRPVGRRSRMRALRVGFERRLARAPLVWRLVAGGTAREPFARLDALGDVRVRQRGVDIRMQATAPAARMAELSRRIRHGGRIRHVHDETFLAWRFANPLHQYRYLCAGEESLAGVLVVKGTSRDPRVSIVHLEALDERTALALLDAAIRYGGFAELATWSAALDRVLALDLQQLGFRPIGGAAHGCPCVLVRSTDDAKLGDDWTLAGVRLLDLGSWELGMIDSMAG